MKKYGGGGGGDGDAGRVCVCVFSKDHLLKTIRNNDPKIVLKSPKKHREILKLCSII